MSLTIEKINTKLKRIKSTKLIRWKEGILFNRKLRRFNMSKIQIQLTGSVGFSNKSFFITNNITSERHYRNVQDILSWGLSMNITFNSKT